MKKILLAIILISGITTLTTIYINYETAKPPITGMDTTAITLFRTNIIMGGGQTGGGGSAGASGIAKQDCDNYGRLDCLELEKKTISEKPEVEEVPIEMFEPPIKIEEQLPIVITTVETKGPKNWQLLIMAVLLLIFTGIAYLLIKTQPKKRKH